jgi:hypothetical protein
MTAIKSLLKALVIGQQRFAPPAPWAETLDLFFARFTTNINKLPT